MKDHRSKLHKRSKSRTIEKLCQVTPAQYMVNYWNTAKEHNDFKQEGHPQITLSLYLR